MVSAGARAYRPNRGLGAEPPAGVQRAEPPVGVGVKPTRFLCLKINFQHICYSFAPNDVGYCLSCLWIHSQNLLSSHCRTAVHQTTSAWVVLRVARWAQGKNGHPLPFNSSLPFFPFLPLEVGP